MEYIELKTLDINPEQILNFVDNMHEKYFEEGFGRGLSWTIEQMNNWFYRDFTDTELILGAYYKDKLLGILGAAPSKTKYKGEILSTAAIRGFGLDPTVISEITNGESIKNEEVYTKFKVDIFKKLYSMLLERIKSKKFDLLYAEPRVESIPNITRYLIDQEHWKILNKNTDNYV